MSLKNNILVLCVLSIWYMSSCANQSTPTGGPKDEAPPVLTNSNPDNGELNFQGQKIALTFDEHIKLNKPKDEIIITPRVIGQYDVSYKKNQAIIEFDDSLQANTTYTLNFREGIQDLNESNSPINLQMAFSTGDYLDSLSISGNTAHLLTNKPGSDISVMLYDALDTLDIFNSPPIYFTKTNTDGNFEFKNLKNGEYNIYALHDKNKNLMLESKNEAYAFLDQSFKLDSNITQVKLPLINLDITPIKVQSSKTRGHYYILKYNKYLSSYTQQLLDSAQTLLPTSISSDHLEIKYYNENKEDIPDSTGLIITGYDTINNFTIDTVFVKFAETKRKKEDFDYSLNMFKIAKSNPILNADITFTKPISYINYDSLHFQIDSTKQLAIDSSNLTWNQNHTVVNISKKLDPKLFEKPEPKVSESKIADTLSVNKNIADKTNSARENNKSDSIKNIQPKNNEIRLYLGHTAFLSVEQDSSSLTTEKASFTNPTATGVIIVKIETTANSYYSQLLSSSGEVLYENYNEKNFSFENVSPGKYTLRILIDQNENQIWDIGNISKNITPEPVIFYQSEEGNSEINLKANWDYILDTIKF